MCGCIKHHSVFGELPHTLISDSVVMQNIYLMCMDIITSVVYIDLNMNIM